MKKDQRYSVRLAKAKQICDYKDIAEHLGVSVSSIYNWLNHQFELSVKHQKELQELLDVLLNERR